VNAPVGSRREIVANCFHIADADATQFDSCVASAVCIEQQKETNGLRASGGAIAAIPVIPRGPVSPVPPVDPVSPPTPVSPVGPVGPVWPVHPVAPVSPMTPIAPMTPVCPVDPMLPVYPVYPRSPVSPVSPTGPCTRRNDTPDATLIGTVVLYHISCQIVLPRNALQCICAVLGSHVVRPSVRL